MCNCNEFDNTAEIKFLNELASLPERANEEDAGYDLRAAIAEDIIIEPGTCAKIGTGLAITPPVGYYGAIVPRSGMASKRGLRPANTPGTCDRGYTGEYIVALYNDSDEPQIIHLGDKIAQLIFLPYLVVEWKEVDELNKSDRGNGGFNSTGTN